MENANIIGSILTALIGVGLGFILRYKVDNRKQNVDEFKLLLDEYKQLKTKDTEYIVKLETRIDKLEQRQYIYIELEMALREEIKVLKNQLTKQK